MNGWVLLVVVLCAASVASNLYLTFQKRSPTNNSPLLDYLTIASAILAAGIPLLSYYRAEDRFRRSETDKARANSINDLQRILDKAISRVFQNEDPISIRANVMVPSGDVLRILCSVNMELDPDNDLELTYGQGCAGIAWKHAVESGISQSWVPVLARPDSLSDVRLRDEWSLTNDMIDKTSRLVWILSTPIFYSEGGAARFIGILNFDGIRNPLNDMTRLEDPKIHQDCADIAEVLAKELVDEKLV